MSQSADSIKYRVFVYGTLRVTEPYHHLLAAEPICTTSTTAQYSLLNLGRYPGMVTSGETAVIGEIYEVDKSTLSQLDEYEDHPNEYIRTEVELADGSLAQAYIFQTDGKQYPQITSGDWLNR